MVAVTRKLQKLPPTSSIPVDQLKAQIQGFKDLDEDKMINVGSTLLEVDQGLSHPDYYNRCDCVLVLQETLVQRWYTYYLCHLYCSRHH